MITFIKRRWTLLNNKRRYIYRHMPAVSYFSLNKIYVLNTVIFLVTFIVIVLWMHLQLHSNIMMDLGAACDDPIATFFNRKIAQKCYIDNITQSATWVDKNMDNIVKTLEAQQNSTNARIVGLYKMYEDRNNLRAASYLKRLDDRKQAFDDLQENVNSIKSSVNENQRGLEKLLDDYKDVIRQNINNLRELATGIVNKLRRNIYTPNYEEKRQKYIGSYNKIGDYLNEINKDDFLGTKIDRLQEIPDDVRNGRV